ncbi:MAG: hypothetical protein ACK4E0_11715 [Chitinophagaceae bacterium]
MQKNKFEKQIREQLEELHFRPSAPVWENVADNIRRRRRRRVLAYFISGFLLLGGGITAASVFMSEKAETTAQTVQINKERVSKDNKSTSAIEMGDPAPGVEEGSASAATTANPAKKINHDGTASSAGTTREGNKEISSASKAIKKSERAGTTQGAPVNERYKTKKAKQAKSSIAPANNYIENKLVAADNTSTELLNDKRTETLPAIGLQNSIASSSYDFYTAGSLPVNDMVGPDDLPGPVAHRQPESGKWNRKGWEWAIEAGAGLGYRREQAIPGISPAKSSRVDLMIGSAVTGPVGGFAIIRNFPSASDEGIGFSIGVNGRHEVTPALRVTGGLRYSYQSEQIQVGRKYDSALVFNNYLARSVLANSAYVGSPRGQFTNQYHFLQVPLGIELKLNKGVKTPISWELGVAPGLLIGSNALVYDSSYNGIYYKDKAQYNRFQLAATMGFSIELAGKKGMRFVLGPELRTNLTALAENGYDDRQYLFYGGLRARVFLPRL